MEQYIACVIRGSVGRFSSRVDLRFRCALLVLISMKWRQRAVQSRYGVLRLYGSFGYSVTEGVLVLVARPLLPSNRFFPHALAAEYVMTRLAYRPAFCCLFQLDMSWLFLCYDTGTCQDFGWKYS